MRSLKTYSAEETELFGEKVGRFIKDNYSDTGAVIALFGGLGMGKTTFVRGVSKVFDTDEPVSSPTFAIVHDYGGSPSLVHFDMYRVEGWDDLETTGFFDYIDKGNFVLVEWSENIREALPDDVIEIYFSHESPDDAMMKNDDENGQAMETRLISWSDNFNLEIN